MADLEDFRVGDTLHREIRKRSFVDVIGLMRDERILWQRQLGRKRLEGLVLRPFLLEWGRLVEVLPPSLVSSLHPSDSEVSDDDNPFLRFTLSRSWVQELQLRAFRVEEVD